MHNNVGGFQPGAAAEESDGAQHDGEPPALVATVEPAVSSSHYPGRGHQRTAADTAVAGADDVRDQTSL